MLVMALAACRNEAREAPPPQASAAVGASATASTSATSSRPDDLPALGSDLASARRALVAAGWTIGLEQSGTGVFSGPPGSTPVERESSSLAASRDGATLSATFEWAKLVRISRTLPPLADEANVKIALAEMDARLGARTWSQPEFGVDRDLAMWSSPDRVVRASLRRDPGGGYVLTESWASR